jgi:hypothetical protein
MAHLSRLREPSHRHRHRHRPVPVQPILRRRATSNPNTIVSGAELPVGKEANSEVYIGINMSRAGRSAAAAASTPREVSDLYFDRLQ